MKYIVSIIILAILGFGIYSYSQKKKEQVNTPMENTPIQENPMLKQSDSKSTFTGTKTVDTKESTFDWTAQKQVIKTWTDRGTVSALSGSIVFENGQVKNGEVVVDMNSISVKSTGAGNGQDKLTGHLKSADFFDVVKYPTAKISVSKVENQIAMASLTVKDVTKPVTFPIQVNEKNGIIVVSGKITIDRSQFGVKFGSTSFFENLGDNAINNDFTIDFSLVTK